MAYDQFWEFEEQFSRVQTPTIQSPINNTIAEANGDMGVMASQPRANPTISGQDNPGNEPIQQFPLITVRDTDPNNVTSMIRAVLDNVSVSADQANHTPSTGVSGNGQNINGNNETPQENDMRPPVDIGELSNRSTIDPIVSTAIAEVNSIGDWLQHRPTSTPFHGLIEEPEMNAQSCGSFRKIAAFMDKNIDPNNDALAIDEDSMAQIGQSLAISVTETRVRNNESTRQVTECVDLNYEDIKTILEPASGENFD